MRVDHRRAQHHPAVDDLLQGRDRFAAVGQQQRIGIGLAGQLLGAALVAQASTALHARKRLDLEPVMPVQPLFEHDARHGQSTSLARSAALAGVICSCTRMMLCAIS